MRGSYRKKYNVMYKNSIVYSVCTIDGCVCYLEWHLVMMHFEVFLVMVKLYLCYDVIYKLVIILFWDGLCKIVIPFVLPGSTIWNETCGGFALFSVSMNVTS